MREEIGIVVAACVGLGVLFLVVIGLNAAGLMVLPWFVEKQTQVYEVSRSHIAGVNDTIAREYLSYAGKPEGAQRQALRQLICAEAASIDFYNLSGTNQGTVRDLCGGY